MAPSYAGRALLLATVCLVISRCNSQDLSKLTKMRQDMENYRQTLLDALRKHGDSNVKMEPPVSRLFGEPPRPPLNQSAPSPQYSESCKNGWNYLQTHNHENYLKIPIPEYYYALDASGKPGAGVLDGNFYAWGGYDECFELDRTQYCIVPVNVSNIPYSFGACVPLGCNNTDLVQFANATIIEELTSLLPLPLPAVVQENGIICDDRNVPYNAGAITMIVVCAVFAAVVLLCSAIDWIVNELDYSALGLNWGNLVINQKPETMTEKAPLLNGTLANQHRSKESQIKSKIMEFVTAFSLFKVIPMILSTKQPPSAITSINGIRVISMFWVILGHVHLLALDASSVDNIAYVFGDVGPRFTFQAIVNATFSVDSFFFLSGLLMAYLTLRQMSRKNGRFPVVSFYVHRYLRLTPTYAFMLFFFWFMTVHLGSGPRYVATTGPDGDLVKSCEKYWWTNLLYINNFYPWKEGDECIQWAWYLANDMQFFVVSPLMVVLLYYSLPIGLAAVSLFLFGSFAATAGIVGYYGFDAAFLGNNTGIPVSSADEIYVKPYARISPYLVGIVLGYMFYRKVRMPFRTIVNWALYLTILGLAVIFLATPLYGLYNTWHGHTLTATDNIFYFTFSRFSWGLGLAFLVFTCHNGYGWIINSFLSMKIWIPLGRLTFTAYLIHPIVLIAVFGSLRSPLHYTDMTMAVFAVGCVVLSYGAAAVVAVFVEFPLSNLESAIFKAVGLGARESTRQVTELTVKTRHD